MRRRARFIDPAAVIALNFSTQSLGLPPRPAFTVEEGGRDAGVGQQFGPAHDSLMNVDRGCADLFDGADDLQIVAEPAGPAIADVDLDHRIGAAVAAELGRLVDPDRADHVRPGPLHELQIIGVIDDAVGVGVLEIDAEREAVLVADKAAAIGRVERIAPPSA